MSIYNISNETTTTNLKAPWATGNDRSFLPIKPQSQTIPNLLCTNFFSNNSDVCDIRTPNDRFSSYGLIKSSTLDSFSNNNNLADIFANFTGSYRDKIHLAIYYKPIKN
jgi:hypothetical protein